jgi:WXG100 family type VII secretion target
MTDKVKADYEALSDAANRFSQESDKIKQIASRLGHGAENLKRSSWTGKGAEAFFKEMESSILPAYRRLADALKEASTITKALSKLFQDAEQEAAGMVKGTGGGSAGGAGADGGEGAGTLGGAIGDAVAAAMGAALGGAAAGAFGGAGAGDAGAGDAGDGSGGAGAGDSSGAGGDGAGQDDLESFPSTLQEALQNALGGAGLKPSGNIIEIVLQKGKGMADTGQQYGADQSSGAGGGGGPSGAGAGAGAPPTETPQETPSSGGGGGGSDTGAGGGGGQGGGASMVEGGSVGTPLGAGQAFWFGATPGSRLSSPVVTPGGGVPAGVPAGGDALGLLASFGATAGAAVLGIVGKTVMGKGLKP